MPISSVNVAGSIYYCTKIENKEIIYRKKIARRLRTQYVESIYSNSVTLKCRLVVTQGYWK